MAWVIDHAPMIRAINGNLKPCWKCGASAKLGEQLADYRFEPRFAIGCKNGHRVETALGWPIKANMGKYYEAVFKKCYALMEEWNNPFPSADEYLARYK